MKEVKCSVCGNETKCEQCGAESEKAEHLCLECYQKQGGKVKEGMHVCIPKEKVEEAYDKFLANMIQGASEEMWNAEKKKLKELSKQELSKTSFFEGARFMLAFMRRVSQESEKEK